MWVAAFRERGEYEGIRESFEGPAPDGPRYRRVTTGTGAEILEAPPETGWPHLTLLNDDPVRTRAALQWINRNLPIQAIVSSGIVTPCHPESTPQDYLIPSLCLRSAGRLDIGSSPVLYEELPFDPGIQKRLALTVLGNVPESAQRLFGTPRLVTNPEVRRWLYDNLACTALDDVTAEIMIVSKRFGLRVGCLKVLETARDPTKLLQEAWKSLRLPKPAAADPSQ